MKWVQNIYNISVPQLNLFDDRFESLHPHVCLHETMVIPYDNIGKYNTLGHVSRAYCKVKKTAVAGYQKMEFILSPMLSNASFSAVSSSLVYKNKQKHCFFYASEIHRNWVR